MPSIRSSVFLGCAWLLAACGSDGSGGDEPLGPPAADWYVSATTGSDGNAGTAAAPFKTLTHALTVALLGESVYAFPGVYDVANGETFPVAVPAGVTLFGDEANKGIGPIPTVINGGGVVPPPDVSGHLLAAVWPGTGSTLAGFCVSDTMPANPDFPFGIVLANPSVTLRNNTVQNGTGTGVYAYNGAGDHVLVGNVVRGHANGAGLAFAGDAAGGTLIEGCSFTGNRYGVELDAPAADLGGGAAGSTGGNVLSCNELADLWTNQGTAIFARANSWDHLGPTLSTTLASGGIDVFSGASASVDVTGALLVATPCP